MSFLPEDYQAPRATSYYMKLSEGENRIRIMSKPVFGWEDWKDNKPVRFAMDKKPAKANDAKKPIKHFWAFVVFNYQEEQIQIMQITQSTIRKSLEALCRDKDWGEPYGYDIKIMKTGEGVDTEYAVNPVPHKPIDPYLVTCFKERPCNLEALFTNADPFSQEWSKDDCASFASESKDQQFSPKTPKVVNIKDPKDEKVTPEQADRLAKLLSDLPQEFVTSIQEFMKKGDIATYADFAPHTYDRILKKALEEHAKIIVKGA